MTPKEHFALTRKLLKLYRVPNSNKAVKELLALVDKKPA
jgi:hypothetical protein